jgi:hypothetical protein
MPLSVTLMGYRHSLDVVFRPRRQFYLPMVYLCRRPCCTIVVLLYADDFSYADNQPGADAS